MAKTIRKERFTRQELLDNKVNPRSTCEVCKSWVENHNWIDLSRFGVATHCDIQQEVNEILVLL